MDRKSLIQNILHEGLNLVKQSEFDRFMDNNFYITKNQEHGYDNAIHIVMNGFKDIWQHDQQRIHYVYNKDTGKAKLNSIPSDVIKFIIKHFPTYKHQTLPEPHNDAYIDTRNKLYKHLQKYMDYKINSVTKFNPGKPLPSNISEGLNLPKNNYVSRVDHEYQLIIYYDHLIRKELSLQGEDINEIYLDRGNDVVITYTDWDNDTFDYKLGVWAVLNRKLNTMTGNLNTGLMSFKIDPKLYQVTLHFEYDDYELEGQQ